MIYALTKETGVRVEEMRCHCARARARCIQIDFYPTERSLHFQFSIELFRAASREMRSRSRNTSGKIINVPRDDSVRSLPFRSISSFSTLSSCSPSLDCFSDEIENACKCGSKTGTRRLLLLSITSTLISILIRRNRRRPGKSSQTHYFAYESAVNRE